MAGVDTVLFPIPLAAFLALFFRSLALTLVPGESVAETRAARGQSGR
jgi:hypothetical protein